MADTATTPAPRLQFTLPEGMETPSVVVDVDALDRNVAAMRDAMASRGVGLRPHTKTSKCIEIVRRQVDAGVVGLTVATLGEAEVLADAGFSQLFQAYPVWAGTPERARRVRELHERCDLIVGVESIAGVEALAAAAAGAERPLAVLIELDPGMHRTGVEPAHVGDIARAALEAGLEVRGAFTFGGHVYSTCDAPGAADDEVHVLAQAREVLTAMGIVEPVLSAGSTATAAMSARPTRHRRATGRVRLPGPPAVGPRQRRTWTRSRWSWRPPSWPPIVTGGSCSTPARRCSEPIGRRG